MSANVTSGGALVATPVSTMAQVKSVKWDPNLQELTLEINDGEYVSLSQVERISAYYLNNRLLITEGIFKCHFIHL